MCTNLIFKASSITSSGVGDTINLFTNITTGAMNFLTGATTGNINIGSGLTTGTITIGNTTSGTNGAQGNIVMGNDDNNLTSANNGKVIIRKLQVGINGYPFRCVIIERNIGAGVSVATIYTIPGAPTTFGNPIVFGNINVVSNNIYSVNIDVKSANTFQYIKRFVANGGAVAGANNESFNYIAIWL